MNWDDREAFVDKSFERRNNITRQKNVEYVVGDKDSLANFKKIGKTFNIDPVLVCSIYLQKHLDSIATFLRKYIEEEDSYKRRDLAETGEGIISRLDDARNYLDIMECLLADAGVHPDSSTESMPELVRTPEQQFKARYDAAMDDRETKARVNQRCDNTKAHYAHDWMTNGDAVKKPQLFHCWGRSYDWQPVEYDTVVQSIDHSLDFTEMNMKDKEFKIGLDMD